MEHCDKSVSAGRSKPFAGSFGGLPNGFVRIVSAYDGENLIALANLSGFDGSPESMRHLQLEYGAAIARAVVGLREGDVLVIAGKGHEPGQIVGDRVLPFDDRQVARAALDVLAEEVG